ncbi:DUF2171 domain-containing protein [Hyalangium versicolor]|uniref:DUF2171 domain-containing protein n=1 Tax=Hyalangium versicolor TaxID=2861190 RepID=UPI001CCFF939|nr:DUF2171 domain-containing protein [Hyalangium versicolor]
MVQPAEVREGMTVRTADGRTVGRVAAVGDVHFELEPGLVPIPRRDFLVDYSDVADVRDDAVYLMGEARLELEEDDDGGALPPRSHAGVDREPVNADEHLPGV